MTPDELRQAGVRVRKLEWQSYPVKQFADDEMCMVAPAPMFKHQYQAQRDPWAPTFICFLHPTAIDTTLWWESKGHTTLDAAKAAAQADYEVRIIASLEPIND